MTNLIPTVIVDKNNKVTTVHKKQQADALGAAIPGPVAVKPVKTVQQKVEEIRELVRSLPAYDERTQGPGLMSHILENLEMRSDHRYMDQVATLLESTIALGDDEVTRHYGRHIMTILSHDDADQVKAVLAHHDYLSQNTGKIADFVRLYRNLTQEYGVKPGKDGRIESMEAHIKANDHYVKNALKFTGLHSVYVNNSVYIDAVEKYANQIDKLIAYREEHPPNFVHGVDDFDAKHFEGVLAAGSLGDGWL